MRSYVSGGDPTGSAVRSSAVRIGLPSFGPLIDRTVALLDTFDEDEVDAVRRFLTGVREIMSTTDGPGTTLG
ncbi:hypothetical protein [Streptomyces sp. NBC_01353]|uniref:hypothetical protein n=1 Tax=Streptomyces sp. NBC_01353 TaxID=2903835 RepID=UPI002E34E6B2|nr:hypothetical protein [Streptomyces sp. NBC_01353]